MTDQRLIEASGSLAEGVVDLPSSKSISNRLLIIRFLSGKNWRIENLSTADDTVLLNDILEKVEIGSGHLQRFNVKNSGTAMRFLTAALSVTDGVFRLDCHERMKSRPIAPLVDSLRMLGAEINYLEGEGFPPLQIIGKKMNSAILSIDAGVSSQFISALLMIAPLLPEGLKLQLLGSVVSTPYISMTISLMKSCGIEVGEDFDGIKTRS